MAIINKTGITTGGTIEAEHITRAIDALSGVSADSIVATGSLLGTASFALTASYAMNAAGGANTTASAINATDTTTGPGPYYPVFVSAGGAASAARIDTSTLTYNATANKLTVTSSFADSASNAMTASVAIRIPVGSPSSSANGQIYIPAGQDPNGGNLQLVIYYGNNAYEFTGVQL
jgi:hypothetical protein